MSKKLLLHEEDKKQKVKEIMIIKDPRKRALGISEDAVNRLKAGCSRDISSIGRSNFTPDASIRNIAAKAFR